MEILLTIHSILRWFIILLAALAIFKYSVSWAGNGAFKGMDRGLAAALSGLVDAQVLLGLVYFLWDGFSRRGIPRLPLGAHAAHDHCGGADACPGAVESVGRQATLQLLDPVHPGRVGVGVYRNPGIEVVEGLKEVT